MAWQLRWLDPTRLVTIFFLHFFSLSADFWLGDVVLVYYKDTDHVFFASVC